MIASSVTWLGIHASLYLLMSHPAIDLNQDQKNFVSKLIKSDVQLNVLNLDHEIKPLISDLIPSNLFANRSRSELILAAEIKRVIADHNFFLI
jgi:hypothetical protein